METEDRDYVVWPKGWVFSSLSRDTYADSRTSDYPRSSSKNSKRIYLLKKKQNAWGCLNFGQIEHLDAMCMKVKIKVCECAPKILRKLLVGISVETIMYLHWEKEQQSQAQNSDSKYRQMALTGFDT